MGVNVFGRTNTERLQITENSMYNPAIWDDPNGYHTGLSNFGELYLDFGHPFAEVTDYRRSLSLNEAIAKTEYTYDGVHYTREYFTSYPDRVLVVSLRADRTASISFNVRAEVPFCGDYLLQPGDGMGKSGEVHAEKNRITLSGLMHYYAIQFEGQITVLPMGGTMVTENDHIRVEGADSAMLIVAVGTNYRMESRVFLERDPKQKLAPYPHPHKKVTEISNAACKLSYDKLLRRHVSDYRALFDRASIDLGGSIPTVPTDVLLAQYQGGEHDPYLEELYFAYGRYLLISSSRKGAYPANLQGTWTQYAASPWTSGYWHNINVQMNYWPAFNTNLCDLFLPYIDYFKAYRAQTEAYADAHIKAFFPEQYETDGENGMTIGTGASLFKVDGIDPPGKGHSGGGTGAFTTKLFTDYCAFTMDRECLKTLAYPANRSMAKFLSKQLEAEADGTLLIKYSASPEQKHNGAYYHTKGCSFDQQMTSECYRDTVEIADALGISDDFIEQLRRDLNRLDPIQVGASGQIKEFREEICYGDIGEAHHRHISHMVGLYPGTLINSQTPEWLTAAERTLELRGDECVKGWSAAHKMNCLARTKNGNRAYGWLRGILKECTFPNLWDSYKCEEGARLFQIDGNFGATAGMAEMLLQSHEGYLHVLPALPDAWESGAFDGLTARGGFTVSAEWKSHRVTSLTVTARVDGVLRVRVGENTDVIELPIQAGDTYRVI